MDFVSTLSRPLIWEAGEITEALTLMQGMGALLVAAVGVIAVKAIMTRSTCRAQTAPIDPFVRDKLVADMRASARPVREEE